MSGRAITFRADMAVAVRDGRKTQTRRVASLVLDGETTGDGVTTCDYVPSWPCPYGEPGDTLWVREESWAWGEWRPNGTTKTGRQRWRFVEDAEDPCRRFDRPAAKLDGRMAKRGVSPGWAYRHARFMPRWASRLTLRVTSVRVERLQEITEEDAIAEGVANVGAFARLWDEINSARPGCAWADNPRVWVVGFEVVT